MKKRFNYLFATVMLLFCSLWSTSQIPIDTIYVTVNNSIELNSYLSFTPSFNDSYTRGNENIECMRTYNSIEKYRYIVEAKAEDTVMLNIEGSSSHQFVIIAKNVEDQVVNTTDLQVKTGDWLNLRQYMNGERNVDNSISYGDGVISNYGPNEDMVCKEGTVKVVYSNMDGSYVHIFNITAERMPFTTINDTFNLVVGRTYCFNENYSSPSSISWLNEMQGSKANFDENGCYTTIQAGNDWLIGADQECQLSDKKYYPYVTISETPIKKYDTLTVVNKQTFNIASYIKGIFDKSSISTEISEGGFIDPMGDSDIYPFNVGEVDYTITAENGDYNHYFHFIIEAPVAEYIIDSIVGEVGTELCISNFVNIDREIEQWKIGKPDNTNVNTNDCFTPNAEGLYGADCNSLDETKRYSLWIQILPEGSITTNNYNAICRKGDTIDLTETIQGHSDLWRTLDVDLVENLDNGKFVAKQYGNAQITTINHQTNIRSIINLTIHPQMISSSTELKVNETQCFAQFNPSYVTVSYYRVEPDNVDMQEDCFTKDIVGINILTGYAQDGTPLTQHTIKTIDPTLPADLVDTICVQAENNIDLMEYINFYKESMFIDFTPTLWETDNSDLLEPISTSVFYTIKEGEAIVTAYSDDKKQSVMFVLQISPLDIYLKDTLYALTSDTICIDGLIEPYQTGALYTISNPNDLTKIDKFCYQTFNAGEYTLLYSSNYKCAKYEQEFTVVVEEEPTKIEEIFDTVTVTVNKYFNMFDHMSITPEITDKSKVEWIMHGDSHIDPAGEGEVYPYTVGETDYDAVYEHYTYHMHIIIKPETVELSDTIQEFTGATVCFSDYIKDGYELADLFIDEASTIKINDSYCADMPTAGTFAIRFFSDGNSYIHTFIVTIKDSPIVEKESSIDVMVGEIIDLTDFLQTDAPLTWDVVDSYIDPQGGNTFYIGKEGETDIVATTEDGSYKHTFHLTIVQEGKEIFDTVTVTVNKYFNMFDHMSITPEITDKSKVEWIMHGDSHIDPAGEGEVYPYTVGETDYDAVYEHYTYHMHIIIKPETVELSDTIQEFTGATVCFSDYIKDGYELADLFIDEASTIKINDSYCADMPTAGTFAIRFFSDGNSYIHTFIVIIKDSPIVEKESSIDVMVGEIIDLTDFLQTDAQVTWDLDDSYIDPQSGNTFYIGKEGETDIVATSEDGSYKHTFHLTIVQEGKEIFDTVTVTVNKYFNMFDHMSITPEITDKSKVEWIMHGDSHIDPAGEGEVYPYTVGETDYDAVYEHYTYHMHIIIVPQEIELTDTINAYTGSIVCFDSYIDEQYSITDLQVEVSSVNTMDKSSCLHAEEEEIAYVKFISEDNLYQHSFVIDIEVEQTPIKEMKKLTIKQNETIELLKYLNDNLQYEWKLETSLLVNEEAEGTFTAIEAGSATVSAISLDEMHTMVFKITIEPIVEPIVEYDTLTIRIEDKFDLNKLLDNEVTQWENSNSSAVGLESGHVWGKAIGTSDIMAYNEDNSYAHWFHINVTKKQAIDPIDIISLVIEEITIVDDHTIQLRFNEELLALLDIDNLFEIQLLFESLKSLKSDDIVIATIVSAEISNDDAHIINLVVAESLENCKSLSVNYIGDALQTNEGKTVETFSKTVVMSALSSNEIENAKVFPSVTKGKVTVSLNSSISVIKIHSYSGTLLLNKSVDQGNSAIVDLSHLAKGAYLITIKDNEGNSQTLPVIKD